MQTNEDELVTILPGSPEDYDLKLTGAGSVGVFRKVNASDAGVRRRAVDERGALAGARSAAKARAGVEQIKEINRKNRKLWGKE